MKTLPGTPRPYNHWKAENVSFLHLLLLVLVVNMDSLLSKSCQIYSIVSKVFLENSEPILGPFKKYIFISAAPSRKLTFSAFQGLWDNATPNHCFKRNHVFEKDFDIRLVDKISVVCNNGRMVSPKQLQRHAVLWFHHWRNNASYNVLEGYESYHPVNSKVMQDMPSQ